MAKETPRDLGARAIEEMRTELIDSLARDFPTLGDPLKRALAFVVFPAPPAGADDAALEARWNADLRIIARALARVHGSLAKRARSRHWHRTQAQRFSEIAAWHERQLRG